MAVKKIIPYTQEWQNLANQLARSYVEIKACKHCGHPHIKKYCCGNETCPNPHEP